MAKWYGNVGFSETAEVEPGLYEPSIIERPYFGDVISNRWKRQNSQGINDDINLSNEISIVADPYAIDNFYKMRYAEFKGVKWKVTDAEVQYPRLILSIGGVWNGN